MSRITTEPHWDKRENNKRKRFVFWPIETKWWNWWRILILTKRKASQYPVGHDRPVLVSCNGCSPTSTSAFPPHSSHRMVTSHASPSETHLHFELRASPLMPQTSRRLAVGLHLSAWLLHSSCVSQWKWVGCCRGRKLHSGKQKTSTRVYFPHPIASVVGQGPANPPTTG